MSRATRWRLTAVLLVAWGLLTLPSLGLLELRGEEATRILPGLTMLEGGDWLRPELAGRPYDNKPPFINWCVAAAVMVTGSSSEAVVRAPSTLFVLLFCLVILHGAGPWFDGRARLLAGIAFLLNAAVLEKARLIEIDATYTALSGMAVVLFVSAWSRDRRGWGLWLPPVLPLALAMMTKGPAHLLFFYGGALGLILGTRELRRLRHPALWLGLILVVLPLVLWGDYVRSQGPDGAAAAQAWQGQIAQRFDLQGVDPVQWIKRALAAIVLALPGAFFLPALWRGEASPERRQLRFLLIGTAIAGALIALVPGLRTRYLMPLYPALALALGHAAAPMRLRGLPRHLARGWLMLLAVGVAGAATALQWTWSFSAFGALIAALALGLAGWELRRKALSHDPVRLGLATVGLIGLALVGTYGWRDHLDARVANRRVAGPQIARLLPADATLHVFGPGRMAFLYYLPRPLRAWDENDPTGLARARFLLIRRVHVEEWSDRYPRIAGVEPLFSVPPRIRGDWLLLDLGQG